MSTIPQTSSMDYVVLIEGELQSNAFHAFPVDALGRVDLTIHRRTDTHHGVTLRLLGHAAEHLVESRRFDLQSSKADDEAIHILMHLSREVFEQYAEGVAVRRRFRDWLMEKAVRHCDGSAC